MGKKKTGKGENFTKLNSHKKARRASKCLASANPHERACSLIYLANVLPFRSFQTSELTNKVASVIC